MIKFLDLANECIAVDIDCDRCKYKKECAKMTEYLEDASPVAIVEMVQGNIEF